MIFGRGGGGGVVNRVTKRSNLNAYREFAIQSGSEGGVRLTGDVDQPLGANVGLRVNGMYEDGESFRRHVDLERYGVNPTLGVALGEDTRVDLSYEYFHDRRTTDRGVPAFGGRPLEGFDRTFFGDPDQSFAKADVHLATFAVEHRFSDSLTLRNRTQYGDYDKFYQNIYPSDLIEATGDRSGSPPITRPASARICSARPTSYGRPISAASTRRSSPASRSAVRTGRAAAATASSSRRTAPSSMCRRALRRRSMRL